MLPDARVARVTVRKRSQVEYAAAPAALKYDGWR